jgi:sulfur-oxidizing protein SoxX
MVAVKRRSVEPAISLDRPAVLAKLHDKLSHRTLRIMVAKVNRFTYAPRSHCLYVGGWHLGFWRPIIDSEITEKTAGNALNHISSKLGLSTSLVGMLALALLTFAGPARAQSAADGQKIAFDRGKGNCLTCHVIKGGDLPGTIGPELKDLKTKYPDRADLVAIVSDETKRNPQTVMPPFGRNRILTEQEINAVVDFLQTL